VGSIKIIKLVFTASPRSTQHWGVFGSDPGYCVRMEGTVCMWTVMSMS